MRKTELQTETILGEVKCNQYLKADFEFLTKNDPEAETEFAFILDEVDGVGSAVMAHRRFLKAFGKRKVTLEQLKSAKDRDELHRLIQDMFLWRIQPYYLDRLISGYSLEQLYKFSEEYAVKNPLCLLTLPKNYAVKRFRLEGETYAG